MQRRQWLTYCAGALVAAGTSSARADEVEFVEFTEDRYEAALASNKPFMVGFLSTW